MYCIWEGGVDDFHLISIRRLANSVTKAIKSACVLDIGTSEMPNRAVIALGSISIPVTSVRVAKISVQYVFNDAHDQNICACVTGVWWHFSQVGSMFSYILESLALVQWVRWTTLHWIKPCLAQTDELWTRLDN